jgi:parvulin-like peptidyl-prolyl isomerase
MLAYAIIQQPDFFMAAQNKKEMSFKKILVSIIIGFVAVAFVGSFAYRYAAKRGSASSIAVVNGEPISVSSDSLFANLYRQYYEEERQNSGDEGMTEETNRQLFRKSLDTVIQRTLILQYAKKQGITVDRETILTSIIKKGYYASPDQSFDKERYNNTPESDRQNIYKSEEEQLIITLFLDEHFNSVEVSELEIESFFRFSDYGKKIKYVNLRYDDLPEDVLKTFYEENPRLFEKAHVSHILIKDDEELANEIWKEVQGDKENFEDIAREKSEDTTKDKGGDLGWFYRKDMVPEFSEAAFALKKGEISPVVKTTFGYHIIKSLDSPKVGTYNEALFRIKREYVNEHREEVEKLVALKSKEILEKVIADSSIFEEALGELGLVTTTTDYITVSGQYVLNEEQNAPLYDLMGIENLPDFVMGIEVGKTGGPIKTVDGEIIFKVIEEKEFNREDYEKSKDYLTGAYGRLKENVLFNDWYSHTLRKSKIVDNFEQFFTSRG